MAPHVSPHVLQHQNVKGLLQNRLSAKMMQKLLPVTAENQFQATFLMRYFPSWVKITFCNRPMTLSLHKTTVCSYYTYEQRDFPAVA